MEMGHAKAIGRRCVRIAEQTNKGSKKVFYLFDKKNSAKKA